MTTSTPAIDIPAAPKPKTKTKTWRSKAQWKALLDEFSNCGLTQAAFCKKHQIATSSLHKWLKYFESQSTVAEFIDITEPLAKAPSPQAAPENGGQWQVELKLGPGVVLRMRNA